MGRLSIRYGFLAFVITLGLLLAFNYNTQYVDTSRLSKSAAQYGQNAWDHIDGSAALQSQYERTARQLAEDVQQGDLYPNQSRPFTTIHDFDRCSALNGATFWSDVAIRDPVVGRNISVARGSVQSLGDEMGRRMLRDRIELVAKMIYDMEIFAMMEERRANPR